MIASRVSILMLCLLDPLQSGVRAAMEGARMVRGAAAVMSSATRFCILRTGWAKIRPGRPSGRGGTERLQCTRKIC